MKAEFSFIEYSYNPLLLESELLYQRLRSLGFVRRARRHDSIHTFWKQDNSIILLTEDIHMESVSCITGLGFVSDPETVKVLGAEFDESRNMFSILDPSGIKNYLVPFNDYGSYVNGIEYEATDDNPEHYLGLKSIVGIVYNNFTPELSAHYEDMGFRLTRSGSYMQYTSENNRFTIAASPEEHVRDIGTVIFDTKDVFSTTARAKMSGASIAHFDVNIEELDFGEINHLIAGYNCLAVGNHRSYVIENFLPDALPQMDHVYSMSKMHVGLNEETLDLYYEQSV